ncbi:AA-permease domain-containing protein [Mycena kentingensis (nom. inval.)]|nr:AA-permease domain-containing protein [Mycena kentingensis (nom. inval.)]
MALRGQAPKIFARTTKAGLPIVALSFSVFWILFSYMALSRGASTVLNWLSNLTSILGFITWAIISFTYIRFYHGMKAQGIDRTKFVYWNRFQPYPAYWSLGWSLLIIFFNGFYVFLAGEWNATDFIVAYINLPIFGLLWLVYKFVTRSKMVKAGEMDFYSNAPPPEMVDMDEEEEARTIGGKVAAWLF